MKRNIFLILILNLTAFVCYAQEGQTAPSDEVQQESTAALLDESDVFVEPEFVRESILSINRWIDLAFAIVKVLTLAAIIMMAISILVSLRHPGFLPSERYMMLHYKQSMYGYMMMLSVVLLICALSYSYIRLPDQADVRGDVAFVCLCVAIFFMTVILKVSNKKRMKEFVEFMGAENVKVYQAFGKFPLEMSEQEKEKAIGIIMGPAPEEK